MKSFLNSFYAVDTLIIKMFKYELRAVLNKPGSFHLVQFKLQRLSLSHLVNKADHCRAKIAKSEPLSGKKLHS